MTVMTTQALREFSTGDRVEVDGREMRVVAFTGNFAVLRPVRWYHRVGDWFRRHVRIRGFWSRVWSNAR